MDIDEKTRPLYRMPMDNICVDMNLGYGLTNGLGI
jgi:hypothetical protein